MTNPAEPLQNSRHEAFAQAFAGGMSASAAYISAGYSTRTAGRNSHRLLKKEGVSRRVAYLKEQIADASIMTSREVLQTYSDIARNSPNVRDRLTALTALGRYHGLFVDRVDHTTSGEAVAAVHLYLPDNGRDPELTN